MPFLFLATSTIQVFPPKTLAPPHAEPRCSQDLKSSQEDVHLSMALKCGCCAAIGRDQRPWWFEETKPSSWDSWDAKGHLDVWIVGSAKLEFWEFTVKKVPNTEYFPLKLRPVRVLIFVITQTSPLLCISWKSQFFQRPLVLKLIRSYQWLFEIGTHERRKIPPFFLWFS